ncbi:MAG: hypothetical protein JXR10_04600 [Cyclobacteriaceae bacterium]
MRILIFAITNLLFFGLLHAQDDIRLEKYKFLSDESVDRSIAGRAGNHNGNIDAGEKISIGISLKAIEGDFISTSAKITTNDRYINVINSKIDFDDIAEGTIADGKQDLVFEIDIDCPHNHRVYFEVKINDSGKRNRDGSYINFFDEMEVVTNKVGPLIVGRKIIDDDDIGQSTGNDDGIIDKEDGKIEVPLTISNEGVPTVNFVKAKLSSRQSFVEIFDNSLEYNQLAGGTDTYTPADYVFRLSENAPNTSTKVDMKLSLTGEFNGFKYDWTDEFSLGSYFYGSLVIDSKTPNSKVYLNDSLLNIRSDFELNNLRVDNVHHIRIEAPNHISESLTIPIKPDKTTRLEATLAERPTTFKTEKDLTSYFTYYSEPTLLPESKERLKLPLTSFMAILSVPVLAVEFDGYEFDARAGMAATGIGTGLLIDMIVNKRETRSLPQNAAQNRLLIENEKRKAEQKAEEFNKKIRLENSQIRAMNQTIKEENLEKAGKRKVEYWIDNEHVVLD